MKQIASIAAALLTVISVASSCWALTPADCTRICDARACAENIAHLKFSRCALPPGKGTPQRCWCVYYGKSYELLFRCLAADGTILATTEANAFCDQPCTGYGDDVNYGVAEKISCPIKVSPPAAPPQKELRL